MIVDICMVVLFVSAFAAGTIQIFCPRTSEELSFKRIGGGVLFGMLVILVLALSWWLRAVIAVAGVMVLFVVLMAAAAFVLVSPVLIIALLFTLAWKCFGLRTKSR